MSGETPGDQGGQRDTWTGRRAIGGEFKGEGEWRSSRGEDVDSSELGAKPQEGVEQGRDMISVMCLWGGFSYCVENRLKSDKGGGREIVYDMVEIIQARDGVGWDG